MDKVDWVMVLATIVGPILAVQAQKAVEAYRERRLRKERVFERLMATRAARLSPEHVQGLNMIDLAFYGRRSRRSTREQAVLNAWKEYHDNLSTEVEHMSEAERQTLWGRRGELFVNLLAAMAADVGLTFDRVQLAKGAYSPVLHGEIETTQRALLNAMLEAFSGDAPLKMQLVAVPTDPEGVAAGQRLLDRIATALERRE